MVNIHQFFTIAFGVIDRRAVTVLVTVALLIVLSLLNAAAGGGSG